MNRKIFTRFLSVLLSVSLFITGNVFPSFAEVTDIFSAMLSDSDASASTGNSGENKNTYTEFGDLTGDGGVDIADLVYLKRAIVEWDGYAEDLETNPEKYDIDGNIRFSVEDAIELKRFLVGRVVSLGGANAYYFSELENHTTTSNNTSVDEFNATQPAETQITDEMAVLAEKLGSGAEINRFIKDSIDTNFYVNSRKGAVGTFEERSGNDLDQASLFIALTRYLYFVGDNPDWANFELAYLFDEITVSAKEFNLLTGYDTQISEQILSAGGTREVKKDGNNYIFDHTFAVIIDTSTQSTVKFLDPSYKHYELKPTVVEESDSTAENNIIENIQNLISQGSSFRTRSIVKNGDIYEKTLLSSETGEFNVSFELDLERSDTVTFGISGTPVFRSAELYGKGITYYFESNKYNNNDIYELFGGFGDWNLDSIFNFPSRVMQQPLYVNEVLKIGDATYSNARKPLSIERNGKKNNVDFSLAVSSGGVNYSYTVNSDVGEMTSFVFDFGTVSPNNLFNSFSDSLELIKSPDGGLSIPEENTLPIADSDVYSPEYLGEFLRFIGNLYFAQLDISNIQFAEKYGIYQENPLRVGRVGFSPEVGVIGDNVTILEEMRLLKQGSFYIDIFGNPRNIVSVKSELDEEETLKELQNYTLAVGMYGSALEHSVFEQVLGIEAVSAAKVLEYAQNDIENEVITLSAANFAEYDLSGLNSEDVDKIESYVNAGRIVTTPIKNVEIGGFSGIGFVTVDPNGLAQEYVISGGTHGGMVTTVITLMTFLNLTVEAAAMAGTVLLTGALLAAIAVAPWSAPVVIAVMSVVIASAVLVMDAQIDSYISTCRLYSDYAVGGGGNTPEAEELYNRQKWNLALTAVSAGVTYLIRNRMFVKPPPSADDALGNGINKPSEEVLVTPSQVNPKIALIENSGLRKETQDILFKHLDDFEVDRKFLAAIKDVEDDFTRAISEYGEGAARAISRSTPETLSATLKNVDEFYRIWAEIDDGVKNSSLRQAYENEVKALTATADDYRAAIQAGDMTEEQAARTLNQARRDIGVKYKDATPEMLREYIYELNIQRYKDPLGPTYEWFKEQPIPRTDTQIIESACRPNKDVDVLFNGFEKWWWSTYGGNYE